ncbi:uncharacterized protein LOC108738802 [Agrilus planipennis]|uniref:Uncharacterized protein LOC108738802 n=1 Tax=Agrilus planipennis TaxID=224129 RepID=A0A1W4WVJ6_AGRPL|nr:uncharacterized protein LOC108738802 [Agrilus planipennis]
MYERTMSSELFVCLLFAMIVLLNSPECNASVKEESKSSLSKTSEDFELSAALEETLRGVLSQDLEPRKKKKQDSLFARILPFLAMPFIMSAMMVPKMLIALKFLMIQAFVVGKIAITLGLINMFRNRNNQGGVYSHNIDLTPSQKQIVEANYGHAGDGPEYGTYVNSWDRKRRRK